MKKLLQAYKVLLAATWLLPGAASHALDTGTAVKVDGFLTLAAVYNDNKDIAFYEANDGVNWNTDSVAGLQVKAPLLTDLDVTAQLVSRGYDDDYDPHLEWLFLTYEMVNNLDVRVGRLRIPFFMFSDSLEVGYSYPWVRPPVDVYGQLGFSRFDGADLLYSVPVSSMQVNVQPFFGKTDNRVIMPGQDGKLEVTNLWGIHASASNDWLTLHAGHTEGDFDIKGIDALDGFLGGLEMAGFPSVADKFGITDRHGTFDGVGLDANLDNWRFISEYTKRGTDGLMANTTGWYATVAYQYHKLTPHLTFSKLKTDENYDDEVAAAALMPGMLAGGTMQFVHDNTVNQDSITAGLRWNVARHTALKFEWQQIDPDDDSAPLFVVKDASYDGDPINVFTIALDAVF